jgi:hypothetical protein
VSEVFPSQGVFTQAPVLLDTPPLEILNNIRNALLGYLARHYLVLDDDPYNPSYHLVTSEIRLCENSILIATGTEVTASLPVRIRAKVGLLFDKTAARLTMDCGGHALVSNVQI